MKPSHDDLEGARQRRQEYAATCRCWHARLAGRIEPLTRHVWRLLQWLSRCDRAAQYVPGPQE